jgi:ferredoxin
MTYVVTERCLRCKYTDCVDVCPVDAFREDAHMLYIDPEECIDCDICVQECPVEAIFGENDLPEKYHAYLEINRERSKSLPEIVEKKDPLPTAISLEEWHKIEQARTSQDVPLPP